MERKIIFISLLFAILVFSQLFFVHAEEGDEDIKIFGLELEKVLSMINAWLAIFLCILSFIAYRRDGRKRLFYVSLAFFLFAIKSFLISSELFFPEIGWINPIATVLEFAVLLSFFYGVLKK